MGGGKGYVQSSKEAILGSRDLYFNYILCKSQGCKLLKALVCHSIPAARPKALSDQAHIVAFVCHP